jgi:L-threonylcarbamoyladenylate synthase
MEVINPSSSAAAEAAVLLKKEGVVICLTDTVYGFLADAGNKKAVTKIYKIKNRPETKPLPVFVKDLKMAKEIAEIDSRQEKILRKYWPGKYTFILKRKSEIKLYGVDEKTIAMRIPNHKLLLQLLKKMNRPLVQTSVNISTQEPLKSAEAIIEAFGKSKLVGLIIDGGRAKSGKSSKIIDLASGKLIRLR